MKVGSVVSDALRTAAPGTPQYKVLKSNMIPPEESFVGFDKFRELLLSGKGGKLAYYDNKMSTILKASELSCLVCNQG